MKSSMHVVPGLFIFHTRNISFPPFNLVSAPKKFTNSDPDPHYRLENTGTYKKKNIFLLTLKEACTAIMFHEFLLLFDNNFLS